MTIDAACLIRTDLYPIADEASALSAQVIACAKADLDRRQVCSLDSFITEDARRQMIDDVMAVLPRAYPNRSYRTCFLNQKPDPSLPDDHPKNIFFDASYNMVAVLVCEKQPGVVGRPEVDATVYGPRVVAA